MKQENGVFTKENYGLSSDNDSWDGDPYGLNLDVRKINKNLGRITDLNHKLTVCNLFPYLKTDNTSMFPSLSGCLYNTGVLFKDIDHQKWCYWRGVKSYTEYVDDYVDNLNPTVLCFDCYPFICDWRRSNSTNPKDRETILTPRFIQTLSFYYNYRKNHGIPFWSTILPLKIVENQQREITENNVTRVEHRFGNITWNDTIAKLRFSVFASLAFGAQGLMIWNISSEPYKNKNEKFEINGQTYYKEAYEDIPISPECTRNTSYYRLQEVLAEVRKLQKVFIDESGYKIIDISVGLTDIPAGTKEDYREVGLPLISYSEFESEDSFKSVIKKFLNGEREGKGWIVSMITKESTANGTGTKNVKEYLIFVNLDVENDQQLSVAFQSNMKDETNAPDLSAPIIPGFPSDNSISFFNNFVEPGGWKIFSRIK